MRDVYELVIKCKSCDHCIRTVLSSQIYDIYEKFTKKHQGHDVITLIIKRKNAVIARSMIQYMKNNYKKNNLIGVEIGVGEGFNACSILNHLSIKKLYLVDPWKEYSEKYSIFKQESLNILYKNALTNLYGFRKKIILIKKKSEDAKNDIPDNLDFVYIDGNHEYDFVKKDLELYYPKIKENGFIGGHDFDTSHFGICKAVMEFVEENNIKKSNFFGKETDWWIIK